MNKNWRSLRSDLQNILEDEIKKGNECGCQLCIRHHGQTVIDIYAGYTDPSCSKKVNGETLFPLFSAGKAVLAALTWKLVEDGIMDFNDSVGKFWKEFNSSDKAGITIEHLLSHRAGMYLLPTGKPDLTDWQGMCEKIAAMTPRNVPGAKCHYHPLTFAWLVGHTLELAAGKTLPELIKTCVLEPMGIDGFLNFGVDIDYTGQIAPVDDTLMPVKPAWEAVIMNDPAIRRCCIPSFNGIGNARSLAKFYSQLRGELVKTETFDHATGKVFRDPADPVRENEWTVFALGMILCGPPENRRMFCGHSGAAGAEAFYMPEEDISFAFVKNRLSPDHPDHPARDRISELLGIPPRRW